MAQCTNDVASSLNEINQRASAFTASLAEADRLAALKATQDLIRQLQTPEESLLDIVYRPTHALCIRVGVDLDIFNTLSNKEGPVALEHVAAVKGADPVLVERVMRILSGLRYVDEAGPRVYTANSMTREMTSRYAVAKSKFIWLGMQTLSKTPEFLKQTKFQNPGRSTGGPFRYAENYPNGIWEWIGQDAERSNDFNTYMEGARGSRPSWIEWFPVKERIIDGFDASQGNILLVDVAGGRGHDTQSFRYKFPDAPGRLVVEDQPRVIGDIHELDTSIERIGFDLFKKQPLENARTYYLKFILHDWSDDDCKKILSNISAAMKKGYSKLVIEEFVLDDVNCEILSATMDWEMMIFCNSMERTKSHWQRLLETAGFSVIKFWSPPGDGQAIIEAELK